MMFCFHVVFTHIVDSNISLCFGFGADHLIGPLGMQFRKVEAGVGALAPIPLTSKVVNPSELGGREIDDSGTSTIDSLKVGTIASKVAGAGTGTKSSMILEVAMSVDGEDKARRKKNVVINKVSY